MLTFLECTDFYKTGHHRQMVPGTTRLLENFTPRAGRSPTDTGAIFIGLQGHLKYDLGDLAYRTFFSRPKADVLYEYQAMTDSALGQGAVTTEHIEALHNLQYLPLEYCALPEGTFVPYKIPMFTVENTHDAFAWVAGYLETLTSSRVWQACTSATTARRNRKILDHYAYVTGAPEGAVDYQGHDFSFRGMPGPEAAAFSGMGHLLFFKGTDTIPSLRLLRDVYDGKGHIGGSIPSTEHMVMCLGGKETELDTYNRLLDLYPTGKVGIVSDTWSLWDVLTVILPKLKDRIMRRNGQVIIRPDSGDPVKILTGDPEHDDIRARKGVVQLQWELFQGKVNKEGYKEIDPHIGSIYGDSINTERTDEICRLLIGKGFVSTSSAFGYGSYSYQYVTRDTHGFAIKATWAKVNGQERKLFKDPITDDGVKKSARGRLAVVADRPGTLRLVDDLSLEQHSWYAGNNLLQPVWRDGRFLFRNSLEGMRVRARSSLSY